MSLISEEGCKRISDAVKQAELLTSGEIRVFLDEKVPGETLDRAAFIFSELGMQKTRLRNAILFYISLEDHKFSILGDAGIHQHVGETFWTDLRDTMLLDFKAGNIVEGIEKGILHAGRALVKYFPRQDDDVNELPDEVARG